MSRVPGPARVLVTWIAVAGLAGCAAVVRQPAEPPATEPAMAPAVVALVDEAGVHADSGNFDQAAASLERALRIEPRNARLWHQLASVRLDAGDARQAIQLATRSNSLAGGNPSLEAANWRLIGRSWEQLGEPARAREAYQRADGGS